MLIPLRPAGDGRVDDCAGLRVQRGIGRPRGDSVPQERDGGRDPLLQAGRERRSCDVGACIGLVSCTWFVVQPVVRRLGTDQPEMSTGAGRGEAVGGGDNEFDEGKWWFDQPVVLGGVHDDLIENALIIRAGKDVRATGDDVLAGKSLHCTPLVARFRPDLMPPAPNSQPPPSNSGNSGFQSARSCGRHRPRSQLMSRSAQQPHEWRIRPGVTCARGRASKPRRMRRRRWHVLASNPADLPGEHQVSTRPTGPATPFRRRP